METTITENKPNWSLRSQPRQTQWNYEPCSVEPNKMEGLWWRVLTKHGPLEKGMANHFTMLALRMPSVQFSHWVVSFVTPWLVARQASLSITNSQSLLKLMSIALVMPSNHLIFCCPLRLPPSIIPSIRVFSSKLILCIRWPKYWSFSFSISPSNEHSGLISFRIHWLDLLAVQGTLKSLLQRHSSKASIL